MRNSRVEDGWAPRWEGKGKIRGRFKFTWCLGQILCFWGGPGPSPRGRALLSSTPPGKAGAPPLTSDNTRAGPMFMAPAVRSRLSRARRRVPVSVVLR